MDSVIFDLYFGRKLPCEESISHLPKYVKAQKTAMKTQEKLKTFLNKDDYKLVIKMSDAYWNIICLTEREKFNQGFNLGMRIAVEAFYDGKPEKLNVLLSMSEKE